MRSTVSKSVNIDVLRSRGKSGATVIKLMMACNDMSLANQALGEWRKPQLPHKTYRQKGAGMYFIRTQMSHLYEGFQVIDEISKDPLLLRVVENCDIRTKQSFDQLIRFLPKGDRRAELESLIGIIRSTMTFHYDESSKLITRAIEDLASQSSTRISSITRGNRAHFWNFKVADEIANNVVVHQIWKIDKNSDVDEKADEMADKMDEVFLCFMDFAGEFIWKYCSS
ncbi:hypothetical protein [Polynucleobacter sp. MWH-Aus1W21]|jgi:hypothetical protein|uniref:hypothetical protein n=1 Tax=Polynucleobacter sp. MWH-Aus1W21 TaxID=1855880 RepID=UPI001BFCD7EB|nr:hypothetical protein [Polynucleobacter sp. MWH-Aus1W21]QWD65518.1 hypothetical protein ICW03_07615 [Polynucleobacter sp. MWH-Aus1W21]HLO50388.1 hypothetical protein [Kamptonema sp.]